MKRKWKSRFLLLGAAALVLGSFTFFPQKAEAATIYEVTSFGANGADTEADDAAIQQALNKARGSSEVVTIHFPKGTYYASARLHLFSNTHLILDPGTTIVRQNVNEGLLYGFDQNNKMGEVGGYNMIKNVTIDGGTWDGGDVSGATKGADILRLDHGSNITIKNASFKNVYDCHHVELIGCRDALVENCTFTDFVYKSGKKNNYNYAREAIQFEGAWYNKGGDEEAWAKGTKLDGTGCRNVTVTNCTFSNVPCGVGQHHTTNDTMGMNYNITVTNNTFTVDASNKATKPAINGCHTTGQTITGNTISGPYRHGIFIQHSKDTSITGNTISGINGIGIFGSDTMDGCISSISNNKISSTTGHGISIWVGQVSSIANNKISAAGNSGICVTDSAKVSSVTKNNIAKSTEHGITVAAKGKISTISGNTITSVKKNGIVLSDNGAAGAITSNKIKSVGNNGVSIVKGKVTGKKGINKNTITSSKRNGITVCDKAKVTTITQNKIKSSKGHAISILAATISAKNGVYKNTLTSSKGNGITVSDNAKINQIIKNKITSCSNNGISLTGKAKIKKITGNTIKKCKKHGIWKDSNIKVKMSKNKGQTK